MLLLVIVIAVIIVAINVFKAIDYELHKGYSLKDSPLDRFKPQFEGESIHSLKRAIKQTTTLKKKK